MNKKGMVLFYVLFLSLISLTVLADTCYNTTTNVYVMNTGPTVVAVDVTTNPMEPGDTIYVWANITDPNGVPDDIQSVIGTIDMGTPTNYSDDVNITLIYNATSGLYYNATYIIPLDSPFGQYNITILATDNFNETATNNDLFNVTDITAPVINSINDTPDPTNPGDTINFTANVSDNVNVDTVLLEIEGTNYTMSGTEPSYWYDTLDTSAYAPGTYAYTVYANDTYGNWATPLDGNFTINTLVSIDLTQIPIDFGNTTIPVYNRSADNGTISTAQGYDGDGVVEGFPMIVNNTGNVHVNLTISGTDLIGLTQTSYSIGVGNVTYDLDGTVATTTALATTTTEYATNVTSFGGTQDTYFWIQIPQGLPSQFYQGNVTICASQMP